VKLSHELIGNLSPKQRDGLSSVPVASEQCLEHSGTVLPAQVVRARRGCVPVFHLHGHLLHPDSIVPLADYVSALSHGGYRHVLLDVLFAASTALMVGHALGDVNIQTALAYATAYAIRVGAACWQRRSACIPQSEQDAGADVRVEASVEVVLEDAEILALLAAVVQKGGVGQVVRERPATVASYVGQALQHRSQQC
jgi:hypothetical protein